MAATHSAPGKHCVVIERNKSAKLFEVIIEQKLDRVQREFLNLKQKDFDIYFKYVRFQEEIGYDFTPYLKGMVQVLRPQAKSTLQKWFRERNIIAWIKCFYLSPEALHARLQEKSRRVENGVEIERGTFHARYRQPTIYDYIRRDGTSKR